MFFNLFKRRKKTNPVPELGERIVLTDLPNPRNHPYTKSCYIGSMGFVSHVAPDGSIDLEFESGATLIVGRNYKYTKITFF